MLAFSRKVDYALVALAELARAEGGRLSSTSLAETIQAPEALLRNILKQLARAGLLQSERGPFGGYALTRDARSLSVHEVVEAVDGPVKLARCCEPDESPDDDGCTHSPRCRIQHGIRMMHDGVVGVLRGVTVGDLIEGPDVEAPVVPLRVDTDARAPETGARALTNTPARDSSDTNGDESI